MNTMMMVIAVVLMMASVVHSRSLNRNSWKTPCRGSTPLQLRGERVEVTPANPSADVIRQTLNTLERKAAEVGRAVAAVKNVTRDERLGQELAEVLDQFQGTFAEYPTLQPLTTIELSTVIKRTILVLSRCFVLLQRTIAYETLYEAVNPLTAPLGRIQDGTRDMLCLAVQTLPQGRRTVGSVISSAEQAAVEAIATNYDQSLAEFTAHLGGADRTYVDYVILRNLGRDLMELRAYYLLLLASSSSSN